MKLSGMLADRSKARNTPGRVLPLVKEGMLRDFAKGNDRRWDIIHPSELSHQATFCPRSVYLRITEGPLPPRNFDFGMQNIFDEGHSIHAKWQARLRAYTPLFGNWECRTCRSVISSSEEPGSAWDGTCGPYGHDWEYREITLDAEDEALLVGHADGGFGNTLVEFKSVGTGTIRVEAPELFKQSGNDLTELWKNVTWPFATHVNQGDIYLWICKQRGLPFNEIAYVYESKWNQQIKEFVVPYNEARSMLLVDQAVALKYSVDNKKEPDCRFPGECKECSPYDERRKG